MQRQLRLDRGQEVAALHHAVCQLVWHVTEAPNAPSNLFIKKETAALFPEGFHEDLKELIQDRFPVPRVIITDQHKSQARFLLARLNPSVTQSSTVAQYGGQANELIYTDDVSLQVFLDHLAKLAVESQPNAQ